MKGKYLLAVVLFDEAPDSVAEKVVASDEPATTDATMDRKSRVIPAVAARDGSAFEPYQ